MGDFCKYACPECGSENTMAMSMVYKHGHAYRKSDRKYCSGHKVDENGRKVPVFENVTYGVYMESDLAAESAPPEKPEVPKEEKTGCLMGGMIFLTAAGIAVELTADIAALLGWEGSFKAVMQVFGTWCATTCAIGWLMDKVWSYISGKKFRYARAKEQYKTDMDRYHEEYDYWTHMYVCMRCGNKYYMGEDFEDADAV